MKTYSYTTNRKGGRCWKPDNTQQRNTQGHKTMTEPKAALCGSSFNVLLSLIFSFVYSEHPKDATPYHYFDKKWTECMYYKMSEGKVTSGHKFMTEKVAFARWAAMYNITFQYPSWENHTYDATIHKQTIFQKAYARFQEKQGKRTENNGTRSDGGIGNATGVHNETDAGRGKVTNATGIVLVDDKTHIQERKWYNNQLSKWTSSVNEIHVVQNNKVEYFEGGGVKYNRFVERKKQCDISKYM